MNRKGNVALFHPSVKVESEHQKRISVHIGPPAIVTPFNRFLYRFLARLYHPIAKMRAINFFITSRSILN